MKHTKCYVTGGHFSFSGKRTILEYFEVNKKSPEGLYE